MSKRIFYVFCPAGSFTGGPTALYQLAEMLKELGEESYLYLVKKRNKQISVPDAYEEFNVSYADRVPDEKESVIVLPETYTDKANRFKKSTIVVWWLSIDNYYKRIFPKDKIVQLRRALTRRLFHSFELDNSNTFYRIDMHLVQSVYAQNILQDKGIKNAHYLFEPLGKNFYSLQDSVTKEDIIVYNPAKGKGFTESIIQGSDLNFAPIQNMTPNEVSGLLKKSKVYIDFGNHPGRDRIPRESVLSDCCIVTSRLGSAANVEDVPIPEKYKFELIKNNISNIQELLLKLIKNHDAYLHDFDNFKNKVKGENELFKIHVKKFADSLKTLL